ncbi:MAG: aminodeoxychorismate/anthranilate synthase component II [Acholeplasmatales bacterium]|nr:aminodeoxychorismate/anthranilate synthase component II [Acholeplasmatales bacterium]
MILLIDNYDSFSYNLYQYVGSINPDIRVVRNDELSVEEIKKLNPSHIIISPGPGIPSEAGVIEDVIREIRNIPILGVCLGHQAICEVYGANIIHAPLIMHGKKDVIEIDNTCPIFKGLGKTMKAARYHSLVADMVPDGLVATAKSMDGLIMGVMALDRKLYGVQFHPESVMTPEGIKILKNFLEER